MITVSDAAQIAGITDFNDGRVAIYNLTNEQYLELAAKGQDLIEQRRIEEGVRNGELLITSTGLSVEVIDLADVNHPILMEELSDDISFSDGGGRICGLNLRQSVITEISTSAELNRYANGTEGRRIFVYLDRIRRTRVYYKWCDRLAHREQVTDLFTFSSDQWGFIDLPDTNQAIILRPIKKAIPRPKD